MRHYVGFLQIGSHMASKDLSDVLQDLTLEDLDVIPQSKELG